MKAKNYITWRKAVFGVIFIVVLLRIMYICIWDELDKNYCVSREIDISDSIEIPCHNIITRFSSNQKRLDSLEIVFTGIEENRTGHIVLIITSGDELIYQTNISLENISNGEWTQIFINAELSQKDYSIHLNASDDCVQIPNILIVENSAPETIQSYDGETPLEGQVAIQYGFLQPSSYLDRIVMCSLWLIFLFFAWLFLQNYYQIASFVNNALTSIYAYIPKQTLLIVLECFFCAIITNCSGITFQVPTKILLYIISLCFTYNAHSRSSAINALCNTTAKKILMYSLYMYAAFSMVGQRVFAYPLDLQVTISGVFVYIIAVLWFIPIIRTLFYLLEKSNNWLFSSKRLRNHHFIFIVTAALLLPALYNLFANNPGISTYDSALTMAEKAHLLYGYDDWHPFFYSLVLRGILNIWDSTYAVIIAQYFFWIYVMLEFLLYLREKAIKDYILIFISIFMGFNAANFLHLNSIWKDIPYALSLFWSLIILAKLTIDEKKNQRKTVIYIELLIALIGIFFYRKNGIVPFIIICLMLMISLRKNIRIWCTLALTISLIAIIKGPVYSHFGVEDTGYYGMYIGLGQEILGVYYAGGEVSAETLKLITTMTNCNNAEYNYSLVYSNAAYDLNVTPSAFIRSYLDTFIKNPLLTLRALINRADTIWDIYTGDGCGVNLVNYHGTVPHESFSWNEYYPERIYVSLYDTMSEITKYSVNSQWISAMQWRCGLFTLLGLIAIGFLLIKQGIRKCILITMPLIGQILSLLLSTGWADFRYYWPLNLMNTAIIMLAVIISNESLHQIE